jgi:glycosyltransferase involved in cell wall biosynthesis
MAAQSLQLGLAGGYAMKILSLPMGADTGGVSAAIGRAFEDELDWQFTSIITTLNYIDYPRQFSWSREAVSEHWRSADVIHLHHNTVAIERLTGGWKGFRLPRRPYIVHFHGTGFREQPQLHLRDMRRFKAIGVVATLDLWLIASDLVEWLPCPVGPLPLRIERNDGMVRIAHAPTNRDVKGTAFFLEAVKQLQAEGHDIELDLIEGVTWAECLERKARADLYYDQVRLGYGNNAIEAWGMGIPVIAGAQPATLVEMQRRFGELPFYRATEATIYDAIKALVQSPDLRAEYSDKGLAHVQRFHDEKVVVEQLKALYRKAAGISEEQAA